MLKLNNKLLAIFLSVLLGVLVWFGFDVEEYQVDVCRSTVSKYVTAEFSEIVSGIDFEGNFYTEIDSWSDQASDVFTETVVNEIIVYPPMPDHDKTLSREVNFDNFRFHTDKKFTVEAFNVESRTSFDDDISKAGACIKNLDTYVDVKTWWTITYASDFDA